MNSEKISQRLTLAANVGVLIGVIFLALEVRHASDMAQAQIADSAVAGLREGFQHCFETMGQRWSVVPEANVANPSLRHG